MSEEEGEDFNGRHRGCEGRWGRNRGGAISKQPQPHARSFFLTRILSLGKANTEKKRTLDPF